MSKEETYYVIRTSCDGIYVNVMSKEMLLKEFGEEGSGYSAEQVLDEMPPDVDPNYWGESLLIIKGKVVSPKAVETVTHWDVD